jgi:integrase
MGTIVSRKRKDGTVGYMARIRIMRDGQSHSEIETFDRKADAQAWMKRRETELARPGALDSIKQEDPTLSAVIDHYLADTKREPGKTKAQVLRSIKAMPIGSMKCSRITSKEIAEFATSLPGKPQTVGNYLSHLASIFSIARPAWGYPLDKQAMDDARTVTKRLGVQGRSVNRTRRPTLDELDSLMEFFGASRAKRRDSNDMQAIVAFALFSTRRMEEITRIAWDDLSVERSTIIVRDMKHPGEKIGNDVRCTLPPEALRIIQSMPRIEGRIFTANGDAISASFTRACKMLGIKDLHFHDLRHEGISRLFEMAQTIPQVASVSGHRSWQSLKRYTHMEEVGDKWANWKWLDVVCR